MKLIAIDLDGTLLSLENYITNENLQALEKAQNEGHIIMICSGRAPEDIEQILKKCDFSCPIAGSNGTLVQAEGKLLANVSMNMENVSQIADKLDEDRIPYRIYTNKGIFVPSDWSERVALTLEGKRMEGMSENLYKRITEQPQKSDLLNYIDNYQELMDMKDLSVQKFFVPIFDGEKKTELTIHLNGISGIITTSSGPWNIEIMDQNGNKGNGLKKVAEYYGIPTEDTVAIGDNFNDVPMLEAAGLSIAMGNADPTVKELCDAVTLSNAENGVAYAFEHFILNQ
ncbi:HAD family phosphatase [Bacillus sp. ISL-18]|uniref:Cof-type HAD-IIB family hydrolase n=1 Tax=Bacillus sp. ISL-18 TaxID=2819118 RepID=UPI001BE5488E|nr:Cof-type HAD-IIB family hydrolase [Bacillus sp. ISL-18]MBT2658500.1 HAD family phosphatase [Bacillus sp. ISL-18]